MKLVDNHLYREYMDDYDRVLCQYVVPKTDREFILKNSHDTLTCGHLGTEKTLERIVHKYYWYRRSLTTSKHIVENVSIVKNLKLRINTTELNLNQYTRLDQIKSSLLMFLIHCHYQMGNSNHSSGNGLIHKIR